MLGVADPRQLQDMRRADGAAGEDDLADRIDPLDRAAAREFDRDRALAVEHDAVHQRTGDDRQVLTLQRRAQIGARGTLAPTAAAGLLDPSDIVAGAGRQVVDVLMIFEAESRCRPR